MQTKQAGPIASFFIGLILLAVGGAVVYFLGNPMLAEAKESKSWPATTGTITVSQVESHRGSKNKTQYSHHVEYVFTVDGDKHTGRRVSVNDGMSSSSSSSAKQTVAQYPVGKETKVYYDPQAPEVCVLEPGATWVTYLPWGIGWFVMLIGVAVVGGALLKLAGVVFFLGAAAATAATTTSASSHPPISPPYSPRGRIQPPPEDDGIEIS